MAKAAKAVLTNLQKDVWVFVHEHGPFGRCNWSTILTQIDHKRRKGYHTKEIRAAVVAMNAMMPCRMKLTAEQGNFGTGLQAV